MAVTCWMPNCCHNNSSHTCRFYKFPKNPKIQNKWLKFIGSDIQPKPYSTICSCHFPEGKKQHGPQIVVHNIKIQDVFSVQPSTPLDDHIDLKTETSSEIYDISSESSPSQGLEKSAEFHETENNSSPSFQDFEMVLITETPTEFHEIEDNSNNAKPSSSQCFHKLVTKTSTKFHKTEDNSNSAKPSTSSFQKDLVTTNTFPAKIHEIKDNSNGLSLTSHETVSTSTKNNLVTIPKPSFNSVALLEAENYFLKKDLEEAKKLHRAPFSFDSISDNNKIVSLYTGLPNALAFNTFYKLMENIPIKYRQGWKVELLSRKDQLLMTLMKIRYNFPHGDLAFRFNVSEGAVANIISTWIYVLHEVLREQLRYQIRKTNKNKTCLNTYSNCKFVADCATTSTTVTEKFLPMQIESLDLLNIKLLGKLWSELHQMTWIDKKNRCT